MHIKNPAMFRNNPTGFIIAIILVPVFGLGLLILLYWYLLSKTTKLSISETEILLEEGIFSKVRSEVSVKSVRTTKISQTFLQRILGVGKIEIYTAGDKPEITVEGLADPNSIRELIKQ